VSYDVEDYKGRNVVERGFNEDKQWRGPATRYDKLALTYRGGAVLRAITLWLKQLGDHAPSAAYGSGGRVANVALSPQKRTQFWPASRTSTPTIRVDTDPRFCQHNVHRRGPGSRSV
jgi:hypothetical protein